MPHRSREPGGGRVDCMQQGQRAGLKDSRQLKSGLWSWEFYTMWTGHLLPPPSASSSVKQRKTGVWYELATSGENTDIQVAPHWPAGRISGLRPVSVPKTALSRLESSCQPSRPQLPPPSGGSGRVGLEWSLAEFNRPPPSPTHEKPEWVQDADL